MAKNSSLFKIEGTLDDVTFYKRDGSHYVRTKGGIKKDRIMNDPGFARTRENMSEFASSAQASKLLRHSLGYLMERVKDTRMISRLNGLLTKVKQHDTISDRGKRQVSIGVATEQGKNLFRGFDFNQKAPMSLVLKHSFELDAVTGGISITGLIPNRHIRYTDGATHVSFSSAAVRLDFDTGSYQLEHSDEQVFAIDDASQDVHVTPVQLPTGSGTLFYLLLIEFYQEFNGKMYQLNNGKFNVLHIVSLS